METKCDTVPIHLKMNLTIAEAAEYSNIGQNKLREIINTPNCPFLLKNGRNVLIKRKAFERYLESVDEI